MVFGQMLNFMEKHFNGLIYNSAFQIVGKFVQMELSVRPFVRNELRIQKKLISGTNHLENELTNVGRQKTENETPFTGL